MRAEVEKVRQLKRAVAAQRKAVATRTPRTRRPKRTSSRIAGEPSRFVPSMDEDIPESVKEARSQYLKAGKLREGVELPIRAPRRKKPKMALLSLSATSRATLDDACDWLEDLEVFLRDTLGDSEQNRRQVITAG